MLLWSFSFFSFFFFFLSAALPFYNKSCLFTRGDEIKSSVLHLTWLACNNHKAINREPCLWSYQHVTLRSLGRVAPSSAAARFGVNRLSVMICRDQRERLICISKWSAGPLAQVFFLRAYCDRIWVTPPPLAWWGNKTRRRHFFTFQAQHAYL